MFIQRIVTQDTRYIGASVLQGSGTGESTPTFPGVPGIPGALENKFDQSTSFGLNLYWSDLLEQGSPQGRGGHWAYAFEGKCGAAFWRVGEDFRPLAQTLGLWPQSDIGLTGDAMFGTSQGNGKYATIGTDVFSGWYNLKANPNDPKQLLDCPGHPGWTSWYQAFDDRDANKSELFAIYGSRFGSAKFAIAPPIYLNMLPVLHDRLIGCGGLEFTEKPLECDLTIWGVYGGSRP